MAVRDIIQAAGGSAATSAAVYVEDVFSTYLYTGTGASQTITNGIDLSTKGGMVWLKQRSGVGSNNLFFDTTRGANAFIGSNLTNAQSTVAADTLTGFTTSGFTLGADADVWYINQNSLGYASWTFRKQAKFFDIVTYTGNGASRTIAHSLGATPGMIIVKRTDTTGNWQVYHKGLTSAANSIQLNLTNAQASATTVWNSTAPTSSVFSVGTDATVNASGGTYVAYLFADSNSGGFGPAGTDSVVACGSFTTDAAAKATISLGWEPQYLLVKSSSGVGPWQVVDTMRGLTSTGANRIFANASDAEYGTANVLTINASGFGAEISANTTYIYLAIRRGPMKTPTDATKVFSPNVVNVSAGTKIVTGFPVDLLLRVVDRTGSSRFFHDRLRGVNTTDTENSVPYLGSVSTSAEATYTYTRYFDNQGYKQDTTSAASSNVCWSFRRAPGFFDVVCYTGTGSATTVSHGLTVAPELIIVKSRSGTTAWAVYSTGLTTAQYYLSLNTTAAQTVGGTVWNSTAPTASVFSVGASSLVNASAATYVAYLFATCPGVSKVGSYTGSGTTKQIDCGFAAGARFVLIKRTDSIGEWYVWDTARGLVSGNDPYLLLNSTAAEVTNTDYIDPYSAGFEISSTAPAAINASGATYIYLAIA